MKFLQKIKCCLTDPSKFFHRIKKEDLSEAFKFLSIISGIYFVFLFILYLAIYAVTGSLAGTEVEFPFALTSVFFLVGMFFIYLLFLGLSFASALLIHFWCWLFGGKGTYRNSYQLVVYANTPSFLLGWIPLINWVAGIYSLILLIIGTMKLHKMSDVRAILIWVIPVAILILVSIALIAFVFIGMSTGFLPESI